MKVGILRNRCINPIEVCWAFLLFLFLFGFFAFFQMSSMTVVITTSNVSLGRKRKRFQCHLIFCLIIRVSAGPKIITESLG